jgi:hypothetical protein
MRREAQYTPTYSIVFPRWFQRKLRGSVIRKLMRSLQSGERVSFRGGSSFLILIYGMAAVVSISLSSSIAFPR